MLKALDSLKVGESYERPFLARLLGYQTFHAISRGIVTPSTSKTIIIFVTKENQDVLPDYSNFIEGDLLHMDGQTNHANDNRIVNSKNGSEAVYMFYREKHHSVFVYYGKVVLLEYQINENQPSKFIFRFNRNAAAVEGAIETEIRTHGSASGDFEPDEEGRKKISNHISYERSKRNREKALEIHGRNCVVCGFNFNEFYGGDSARDYIEVHHIESITTRQRKTNPHTDLFPVCSNCHSMLHRDRSRIMPIEELKTKIRIGKNKTGIP